MSIPEKPAFEMAAELARIPVVADRQEITSLLDRAFASPEDMTNVVLKRVSASYEQLVVEYPYLEDRTKVIPPTELDYGGSASLLDILERNRGYGPGYYVPEVPVVEPEAEGRISYQPADAPTFNSYVHMIRQYWRTDGCSSCGICENGRLGPRTVNLIRHQSLVNSAVQIFAGSGDDEAIVRVAEMSILDGLQAYTLIKAIQVNRYLPKTLASYEKLISRDDYVPFNAFDESMVIASFQMIGVSPMNFHKLRQRANGRTGNNLRIRQEERRVDMPDYVGERLAQFKPRMPEPVKELGKALPSGVIPIPIALQLDGTAIDAGYALAWLAGRSEADSQAYNPQKFARLNPKQYDDERLAAHDGSHSQFDATHAIAYSELGDQEAAWLHLMSVADDELKLQTVVQLVAAGNRYATEYIDELLSA